MGYNVAIDGPAGAGKSTIAKLVAKEKGYIYVDTGALYRGLAVHFLDMGVSPEDRTGIIGAVKSADVTIQYEDGAQQVYLNGKNITARLRDEAVGNMASMSSAIPEVRAHLLALQQNMAREKDVIMDAKRRYDELTQKGVACDLAEIEKDIRDRDERDMTRETAPLKQAKDAVLIDSSHMSIEEVAAAIVALCK